MRHHALLALCLLGWPFAALARDPDPAAGDLRRVIRRFETPEIPWTDLLAEFEKIEKGFPGSTHAAEVKKSIAILRRMIVEEKARSVGPPKPEKLLTTQDRVAELIFRLPEQNGRLHCFPGGSDPLFGSSDKAPAEQLVRIGYEAVPQLIDALDDVRFSRSIDLGGNLICFPRVFRVGDCARRVLEEIAGRRFYGQRTTSSETARDEEVPVVRRQVREWWAEFQKKGEKQMLVEGVAVGNDDSPVQAQRLVEKYPDAALPAIRAGARATVNSWIRAQLVDAAGGLKGGAPLAFLRDELYSPSPRGPRVAAARALLLHGSREGVAAMIGEWKRLRSREPSDDVFDGPDALFGFLAESREPSAVRALADGLRDRPVRLRTDVILNLGRLGMRENEKPLAADLEEEVESLLVAAMADGEVRWGLSSIRDGVQSSYPRVGDLAAYMLVRRQGRQEAFSFAQPLRVRDAERLELINEWRNRKGLGPLPNPAHWNVKSVDAAELRPLLLQLERARVEAERKVAADRIEAKGVAALPGLWDEIRLLPAGPAAAELEALIGRLTFHVVDVRTDVAPSLDRALARRVEGFKGKAVTRRALLDLLVFATRAAPPGTRLELHVHRPGNQTGAELFFRARPEAKPKGGETQLEVSRSVSVDVNTLLQNSLLHSRANGTAVADWDDLMEAVREAFAATAGQEVLIRVKWISSR